jgi:hypothetical protein
MSLYRPPIEPRFFDLKGAYEYLGGAVSVRRLRQALVEPDGLRHFRMGGSKGKILIAREDLDSYVRRHPNEPTILTDLVNEVLDGLNAEARTQKKKRKQS